MRLTTGIDLAGALRLLSGRRSERPSPVVMDRYAGTTGNTHGESNETTPPPNATASAVVDMDHLPSVSLTSICDTVTGGQPSASATTEGAGYGRRSAASTTRTV